MAVIFSYPIKSTPDNDDLILISDGTDNLTKQVRVSTLPGGSASGVASLNTLTQAVTITGGTNVTLNTVGNNIEINASGGGDTYTLQAEAKSNNSVPLKLDAATGTDSTVSLTEGSGVTLTRNSATEITIAATGGNAGVSSFTNANGTYVSAGTVNTAAINAVTMGTIDLSAQDGSSATNTTRFLSKDNEWAVPSYTAAYSLPLATNSARGGIQIGYAQNAKNYPVQLYNEQAYVNVPWTDNNTTYDVMGSGNNYDAGLVLAGNATHGDQFLRKDGTWQTVSSGTNTNIGGNNLILSNNRTLNFYSDTTDKSLTFIGGDLSGTKTLFKFDTVINKPRFTVGDTASAYEGSLHIMGNGSNRSGYLKLFNAAGTNSVNIQAPTTFGSASDIPYVLPNAQGGSNTYLKNDGSGGLSWGSVSASPDGNNTEIQYNNNGSFGGSANLTYASDTLTVQDNILIKGDGSSDASKLKFNCFNNNHHVEIIGPDHANSPLSYSLTLPNKIATQTEYSSGGRVLESNASGALQWIATPTGGSGSSASLGFSPFEIYSATTSTTVNYIYYMVAVCDVDFTVEKCKVAVTSGTDPVYVAVYSMTTGDLQTANLNKIGSLEKTSNITTGVNELALTESSFPLTAGQIICIGVSTACQLASGGGLNGVPSLSLMATSGGGSALPNNPDFEGLNSANTRPAIHFYAL